MERQVGVAVATTFLTGEIQAGYHFRMESFDETLLTEDKRT